MPGSARDVANGESALVGREGEGGRGKGEQAARVAQSVEHTLGKGEVIGSIPIASLNDYTATRLRMK